MYLSVIVSITVHAGFKSDNYISLSFFCKSKSVQSLGRLSLRLSASSAALFLLTCLSPLTD